MYDQTNGAVTNNGANDIDSNPDKLTIYAYPYAQTLTIDYTFPKTYTPSSAPTYTTSLLSYTNEEFKTANATFQSVPGYTTYYSYNGSTPSTTIPMIIADNTNNPDFSDTGDTQVQVLEVTYVADDQAAQLVVGTNMPSTLATENGTIIESTYGVTGGEINFSETDDELAQVGYSYTVTAPNGKSYTTLEDALNANNLYDNTDNTGANDGNLQTFTVNYTVWNATIYYYTQEVDADGNKIGEIKQINATSGPFGTDFSAIYGGATTTGETASLQKSGVIPNGYHVTTSIWSNTPDGLSESHTPTYQTDWNWNDTTVEEQSDGSIVQEASIVYTYTADNQQAEVTIEGVPSSENVYATNGTTTYEGMTGQTLTIEVTSVPGCSVQVTDSNDNVIPLVNNGFTITYDDTNNGMNTTDSAPQDYTISYIAQPVTIHYALVDMDGNLTDITSAVANGELKDSLNAQMYIGDALNSDLASNANSETGDFQTADVLAQGYHLTGTVYWNVLNNSLPIFLTVADVVEGANNSYSGTIIFQYSPDVQQATMMVNYLTSLDSLNDSLNSTSPLITNGVQTLPMQAGTTNQNYSFNLSNALLAGYYTNTPVVTGIYDDTNNGANTSDSQPQNLSVNALPSQQSLSITYNYPNGYTNSLATTALVSYTNEHFDVSKAVIPQIDGYTTIYMYGGTSGSDIPMIVADSTANGTSLIDAQPQNLTISYTADTQEAQIVTIGLPANSTIETVNGLTGGKIMFTTDDSVLNTIGYSYTVQDVTGKSYSTLAQALAANPTFDATNNDGASDDSPQIFTVVYAAWSTQVNYYIKQVDENGNQIGALSLVSSLVESAGYDFTQTYGTDTSAQTNNLQAMKTGIPQGYHVLSSYWGNQPNGTTADKTPPYTNDWTFNDMTNIGTSASVNEQASIVYVYTADTQQASVTIMGAPTNNTVNIANGTMNYTGVTAGIQTVNVPSIDGYLVKVADNDTDVTNDNFVYTNSGNFSFTYDDTNNGANETDSVPQSFTITYEAKVATVQLNYQYGNETKATVSATSATDTNTYAAPTLPINLQISAATNTTYSVTVPSVVGYTWAIKDSNGNTYTPDTLPKTFTSNGDNICYTVTYTAVQSQILINFYEAIYHADGTFAFTTNSIDGMPQLSYNGAVGSLLSFGVTESFINATNAKIPNGWSLDPMNAATALVKDAQGDMDNDNLNGSNTAKELLFTPSTQSYAIYLAKDIQSVQVRFINDPQNTPVLYQDGRTGEEYAISTDNFARAGYTYTITDNTAGKETTSVMGNYDATNNANANSQILNNGDGDSNPQVYTVTYTPDYQQALLEVGTTVLETMKGTTGAPLSFMTTDGTLVKAGYTYTISAPDGKVYGALEAAVAANKYYDTTDNPMPTTTDNQPQIFQVNYQASYQQAQIVTDGTDPNGAQEIESTTSGMTDAPIEFASNDSTLIRPGYSYTLTGPDGKTYSTLAQALQATPNYDDTMNGTSKEDSAIQTFTVTYTANAQTVEINYIYSASDNDNIKGAVFNEDGTPNTTTNPNVSETMKSAMMSVAGYSNVQSTTTVNAPTIDGYTANVSSITPSFAIDSMTGDLITPIVTVTYTADTELAQITYKDTDGNDITSFAASCNSPLSVTGETNQQILSDIPVLPGYDFSTLNYTDSNGEESDGLSAIDGVSFTAPDASADELVLIYTPKNQTVTINYQYSTTDQSPKDSLINSITKSGASNQVGEAVSTPLIDGYTPSLTSVTPDYTVDSKGNLVTPTITVLYMADMQTVNIHYTLEDGTDLSSKIPSAPSVMSGVTDQAIGSTPPNLAGYELSSILYNGAQIDDSVLTSAFYTAPDDKADTIQYIYTTRTLEANVHYLLLLPVGYNGEFGGITTTYADNNNEDINDLITNYNAMNGKNEALIPSNYTTITGQTDTVTQIPVLTALPQGWQVVPSAQNAVWTVDSNGDTLTKEYYFYVSPNSIDEDNIPVQYFSGDGTDDGANTALNALLQQAMKNVTFLDAMVSAGETMNYTGALQIAGYNTTTFPMYKYGDITGNFLAYNQPNSLINTTDKSYQSNPFDYDGSQAPNVTPIQIYYTPDAKTIAVNYVYASSQSMVHQASMSAIPTTVITGVSNGTTWSTDTGLSQADSITIPSVQGYTASATSITPDFEIDGKGNLIAYNGTQDNHTITVTYTANPQSAMFTYQDITNASDITDFAIGAGAPSEETGSTDGQILSTTPNVPGYIVTGYTINGGEKQDISTLNSLNYMDGKNDIQFLCQANPQQITVNYLYASGAKKGLNVFEPSMINDGVSNGTTPISFTNGQITPLGYTLITPKTLSLNWTVNAQDALNYPNIYYYYQPNSAAALIHYGVNATDDSLDAFDPVGTRTGMQTGLTDDPINASGPVNIAGYAFSQMVVNGEVVATTAAQASAQLEVFKGSNDENTPGVEIYYVYVAEQGKVNYTYVDQNGDVIAPQTVDTSVATGGLVNVDNAPELEGYTFQKSIYSTTTMPQTLSTNVTYVYSANPQTMMINFVDSNGNDLQNKAVLTGVSDQAIDYYEDANGEAVNYVINGYTLTNDPRAKNTDFDTVDDTEQTIDLVYTPNPQSVVVRFNYTLDGATWQSLQATRTVDGLTNESTTTNGASLTQMIMNMAKDVSGYKWLNADGSTLPTTFDSDDDKDQIVDLYYAPVKQAAVLLTDTSDPLALGTGQLVSMTDKGYTKGPLGFSKDVDSSTTATDANLVRAGYTYSVEGPDGVWYDSLSIAIQNNATYDSITNNAPITDIYPQATSSFLSILPRFLGSGVSNLPSDIGDLAPQIFTTSYTPLAQTAFVETKSDPSGDKLYEGVSGVTDAVIGEDTHGNPSLNVSDKELSRQGYTYVVVYSNGLTTKTYANLEAALTNNATYDANTASNQQFLVRYTADNQTVRIKTDKTDPTGEKTVQVLIGGSNSVIPTPNDAKIYRKGFLIASVLAPDGKSYGNMASALAMNENFDNNDVVDGVDEQPQIFTIHYIPIQQMANLILKNDPNGKANQTKESVSGKTYGTLDFKTTDATLARKGYSYTVIAPNAQIYKSLTSALLAYSKFAAEDLKDGKAVPQNFTVVYKKLPLNNQTSGNTTNKETMTKGKTNTTSNKAIKTRNPKANPQVVSTNTDTQVRNRVEIGRLSKASETLGNEGEKGNANWSVLGVFAVLISVWIKWFDKKKE